MPLLHPSQSTKPPRHPLLSDQTLFPVEVAKTALCKRLNNCAELSFNEKVLVQQIGEALLHGDISKLQKSVCRLEHYSGRWREITNAVSQCVSAEGVHVLPIEIVRWRFSLYEEHKDMGVLALEIERARRVLLVATDERFGLHVFGKHAELTEIKEENANVLLRQTARELRCELAGLAPLFGSAY